jgi:hypothetical protein
LSSAYRKPTCPYERRYSKDSSPLIGQATVTRIGATRCDKPPTIRPPGSCTIGEEKPEEISGEVPKTFTYDLKGRSLDCEISSDGDLRVELTVGNAHSMQSISGGSLHLTCKNGSISFVSSSSSRSSTGENSSTSIVTSSAGSSRQEEPSPKTNEPANVTKESRDVSGFDEVELRGVGNLSIEQTGSESLSVEAQEDVLPKLTTKVVKHRLIISLKPNTTIHTTEPINYNLTVKDLSALKVLGSANVEAEGISTDRLAVTINGAADVRMSGKADEQQINILGSGDYQAENLESKEVTIDVMGSGSAIVKVSEELDAEVSGIGSVEYIGDPTVKQNVSGLGRISRY